MAQQSWNVWNDRAQPRRSLQILDLGLSAYEIEAKVKYQQLARIYHPDKNNQATTGLTTEEASEFFKLLNNANE